MIGGPHLNPLPIGEEAEQGVIVSPLPGGEEVAKRQVRAITNA